MGKMPLPKKLSDREKEEIHRERPPFLAKKAIEFTENPELYDQKTTKIEDFSNLYYSIWKLANKDYQKEFWNKHGQWGDNYSETMEDFLSVGEGVLEANDAGRVSMTEKQREMLQKFYNMMEDFEENGEAEDPGYGVNDAAIIEDPLFDKCRKYAKFVYEELSGDDLDAWEKTRPKQNLPIKTARKDVKAKEEKDPLFWKRLGDRVEHSIKRVFN